MEPGDVVGRFKVESLLGSGGMGEVYKAWDPTLERSVALKALMAGETREVGAPERFRREALALAQLNHPNVCQVHDWVDGPNGTFIAMELLEGKTLDEAAPGLSLRDRLQVIRGVALALEAAHAKGLVHRDLKPSNIMVAPGKGDQGPKVKVLDFGLARLAGTHGTGEFQLTPTSVPNLALLRALEEAELKRNADGRHTAQNRTEGERRDASGSHSWEQLTQAGTFMGSPSYASPEQIQGQAAGPSSDVFSLGIVGWELLAGEHPFPGEGRARMRAIVEGSRRELKVRGLPSGTSDLLRAMLDTHPFKRPTAARVAETMGNLLRPHSVLRWAAVSILATLLLAASAYTFLGRGIIADLTRERPVRLVVLPFRNAMGEARFNGLIHRALPEDAGASLSESPKLQVVEQETLAKAAKKLGLNLEQPLDEPTRKRLLEYLDAALILHGEVKQSPGINLHFALVDASGRVRTEGLLTPEGPAMEAFQSLPAGLSQHVLRLVDPGYRKKQTLSGRLNGDALLAYGQGIELMDKGSYKEALVPLRSAAFQAPFAPGPVTSYASCLYRTGDASTDATLRWALSTARLAKDRYREVIAMKVLALREREQGHLDAAASAGREGFDLAEKGGFELQRAAILSNLGLVLQDQNHLEEAKECFVKASEAQTRIRERQGLANSMNNLAVIARKQGDFTTAQTRYEEALAIHKSLGNRYGEALAHTNLGDLTLSQRRFKEASEHLITADALYLETGNRTERAVCQINLGVLSQCQFDFPPAEAAFQRARQLATESQAAPTVALASFYLAGLSRQRGRMAEAMARYTQALQQFRSLEGSEQEVAECLAGLVECELQKPMPNFRAADRLLNEAKSTCKPTDPFLLRAQWRRALSAGQTDQASRFLDQAMAASKKDEPEVTRELEELRLAKVK